MRNLSTRRYEPRSPISGSSVLAGMQHTSGRRDVRRFSLDYQLQQMQAHMTDLLHQWDRARRLNRPEKCITLMRLMDRTQNTINGLTRTLAERAANRKLAKSKDGGKVLLDLTYQNRAVWGKIAPRYGTEIVNHGKVFRFTSE